MSIRTVRTGLVGICVLYVLPSSLVAQERSEAAVSIPTRLVVSADTANARLFRFAALAAVASPPHQHRRANLVGGIVGGVIGGLGSAAFILNLTSAQDCITYGPPCPHETHVVLHSVTIVAGTAGGAAVGAWVGRRISDWRGVKP